MCGFTLVLPSVRHISQMKCCLGCRSRGAAEGRGCRARRDAETGAYDLAAADLNTDRRPLQPETVPGLLDHERARLTLVRDDAAGCSTAGALIAKAKALIEETRTRDHEGIERHYALPTLDIALRGAHRNSLGAARPAYPHLAKVSAGFDRGWKIHSRRCRRRSARGARHSAHHDHGF